MVMVVSRQVDFRNKDILVPVLMLRHTLRKMRSGEILELLTDDPAAALEIRAWSKLTGHTLIGVHHREDFDRFYIQKTQEVHMADPKIDQTLDCSGMLCPLPVVKTNKAIKGMETGQVLEMISTDPGSIPDMQAWARQTGHELLSAVEADSKFRFVIRKTH